ncbi:MAG: hypothetical protein VX733_05155 [Candidatus Latescibacterota bacterium]|nr:hypothetical protein [Candidatus Latescibacterota bacterium]
MTPTDNNSTKGNLYEELVPIEATRTVQLLDSFDAWAVVQRAEREMIANSVAASTERYDGLRFRPTR